MKRTRIEVIHHPDGRRTLELNGTPLLGDAHFNVARDQNGRVVWVDLRIYMPRFVDEPPPKVHPNPHPWVMGLKKLLGGE